jgi:hypothetical protein
VSLQTRLEAFIAALGADIKALQAGQAQLVTVITPTSINTDYPNQVGYWRYVILSNGWPVTGIVTGYRFNTAHKQVIHGTGTNNTFSRLWNNSLSAWSPWYLTLDAADFRAKGDLQVGTDIDAYTHLNAGANGTVLTADSTQPTGLAWTTPSGGGGGSGTKVSALPAATALVASDTLPVVQGGSSVKATVAQLKSAMMPYMEGQLPTGYLSATLPRSTNMVATVAFATTGVIKHNLMWLRAGMTITTLTFYSGTTAGATLTGSVAGLYSSVQAGPVLLASSANNTAATLWSGLHD